MVIMARQYFPCLSIWKVHRIKPMGLKKVKRQPTPDPLFFTNPITLLKELEWYVTISA